MGRSPWVSLSRVVGVSMLLCEPKLEDEKCCDRSCKGELQQYHLYMLGFHLEFLLGAINQGSSLILIPSCTDFIRRQSKESELDYTVWGGVARLKQARLIVLGQPKQPFFSGNGLLRIFFRRIFFSIYRCKTAIVKREIAVSSPLSPDILISQTCVVRPMRIGFAIPVTQPLRTELR